MQLFKTCEVCEKRFEKTASTSRKAWAARKCCSIPCANEWKRGRPKPGVAAALRGRTLSPEHRAKQSATLRRLSAEGKLTRPPSMLGLRREQTSQWKGDDVKYRGAHNRLDRERGRPQRCEHCESTTARKFEWALRHDAEVRKSDAEGRFAGFDYSPRPTDYLRLCTACHHAYDGREQDAGGRFA